jgi:hypothetical protein
MTSTITARFIATNTPTVPASFWESFVSVSHDKSRPVVMEQSALIDQLLTLEDAFYLAKNVIESGDMTVNADGKMLKQPSIPEFPVHFEGFEAFVRQFAAQNNAEGITFTRDYCLKHSSAVAAKLRAFTYGYTKRYGVPYPGANAVFIGGRYRSTWIGLHNDSCDTFLFPVYGRKRMMMWPPSYFESRVLERKSALNGVCFGHVDISPYAADATVYEVAAGEIFFIPAGWWHYNKLDELETTLTVSVGMFSQGTVRGFCENPIKASFASEASGAPMNALGPLPSTVFESLAQVQLPTQATRFIDTIRDNSKIQMLLKLSSNGVIRDRTLDRPDALEWSSLLIRARLDSPLFLLALEPDAGLLFAGGAMLHVARFRAIRPLVTLLQHGALVAVTQLLSGQPDDEDTVDVVRWLYVQAAIDVSA